VVDPILGSYTPFPTMKFVEKVMCGTLAVMVGASAQDTFEAPDFNVTEALIQNGVNVTAMPELAGLAIRSSSSGCSIAVSFGTVPHCSTS